MFLEEKEYLLLMTLPLSWFCPISETESMVLAIEELLNSKNSEKYPQVGEILK